MGTSRKPTSLSRWCSGLRSRSTCFHGNGSQSEKWVPGQVNMVSNVPPQQLIATASNFEDDMMRTLVQTNRHEFKKSFPQTIPTLRIHVRIVPTVVPFVLIFPDQIEKMQIQTKTKIIQIQTPITTDKNNCPNNRYNNSGNQQNNRYNSNRNTPNQQQNKNNRNQQPCSPCNRTNHQSRDYQVCFNCGRLGHMSRNEERHDKINTIGNKIRILTKTIRITTKTAKKTPHSNKLL